MASIELSAGWMTPMPTRILRNTDTGIAGSTAAAVAGLLPGASPGTGQTGSEMFLMKGTIPSTPTLANVNARLSDVLVRFRHSGGLEWNTYSIVSSNPVSLTSQFVTAGASGTASWFWWVVVAAMNSSPGDDGQALTHQVIGTVGLTGSGADLEMVSTAITAGEIYRIANLKILFPSIWTY